MGSRVPSITQVRPGVAVSIILKQDQPTGRQVQGTIQDVLTRGNHPRGIKVRLSDGRIGRVQRVADTSKLGSSSSSGGAVFLQAPSADELQRDMAEQQRARGGGAGSGPPAKAPYWSERLGTKYSDFRTDEGSGEPEAEMDLMAFVKPAKPKKKGKGKGKKGAAVAAEEEEEGKDEDAKAVEGEGKVYDRPIPGVNTNCPFCFDFFGDAVAIMHHMEKEHPER